MIRWIIILVFVILSYVGVRSFLDTPTFREAEYAPDIVQVKVTSVVRRWSDYRAVVLQTLKGNVLPGSNLNLLICCDFDPAVGDELVIMTDTSRRQIWLCGKEGGWPGLRYYKKGAVPWDECEGRQVPFWFWSLFIPRTTLARPASQGG